MKKIAILMVLMMGLLALAGCSSDNESVMLEYDLLANVETPDGVAANGANVTINSNNGKVDETKTADENGVVQFKNLVSDTYTLTANYDIYRAMDKITIRGNDITAQVKLTDKLYLYSSEFGSSYEIIDWGSEAGLSEESIDGYDNVFKVESAGKWNIGIMAFIGLSDSYQSDYESISFKVKSEDLDQITVKIPEVESTYTIDNGKDLGNGWYELTVPFSDFSGTNSNADAIGIIGGSEADQSFYITDAYFTVDSSVEETEKTPESLAYQADHTMTAGTTYALGGGNVTYTDGSSQAYGPTEGFTFSSSDENVATIDGTTLTAEAEGTATITASYTENETTVTANMALTVEAQATAPAGIFDEGQKSIEIGTDAAFASWFPNEGKDVEFGGNETSNVAEGSNAIYINYDVDGDGIGKAGGIAIAYSDTADVGAKTPKDISEYTELVFAVKATETLNNFNVKLEWNSGSMEIKEVPTKYADSADTTTYSGWTIYTIPLVDFTDIDKSSITVPFSFWHPNDSSYAGTVYIDDVYFQ